MSIRNKYWRKKAPAVRSLQKISEQVFYSVVQSINAAVILHNRQLEVVFVNDAFEAIFEIDKEDAIGRSPMEFLPDFDGQHKRAILDRLKTTLSSGEKSRYHEFNYCTPSGRFRCLVAISIPVFDQSREITHVMSLIHDITRRKELEQEVVKAARLSSIADMAYTIAHEINNPLTGIKLGLDTLYDSLQKEENIQVLDSVMKDLNRIQEIVHSFLRARKRQSKMERHNVAVISDIMEDVLFHLSGQLDLQGITVEKRPCKDRAHIVIDRDRIYQVFLNVLLNAIQAMEERGKITIAMNIGRNEGSGSGNASFICVSVHDTGGGVDVRDREDIFRPFYSTRAGGTGLGLSICKDIVTAHRGRIKLESESGRGTAVKIHLPIADE
jgi:PAS domain S-box-containing protein